MLDTSKIYTSITSGDFKIVKYTNKRNVIIRFIKTGYTFNAQSNAIKKGQVKDRILPSVYSVGFLGVGNHKASRGSKAYKTWLGMLERCYCLKYQSKKPTYKDCSVTKEWHNFQNFAGWFELNYIKGCDLDKDIKQRGVKNKIYSPKTCLFVTPKINSIESHAKHYIFLSPKGIVTSIYNMSEFCKHNKLSFRCMSLVSLDKIIHHKGWTKV